jgi:S-formylglutathione hydrolase FrmB
MAHIVMNFESQYLHGNTEISIILPDKPRETDPKEFYGRGKKYRVLWLFHGSFGDHTDWVRKSNIETYACENDLIVVMPSAMNSNYTDWTCFADGFEFQSFFFDELMPLIYGWYPASPAKEDNFIAGLSMGGSGALKFALVHPEKFNKAAVLSSSPHRYETDLAGMTGSRLLKMQNTVNNAGGMDALLKSDDNVWALCENADVDSIPPLYCGIGGEDQGIERFERFKELCEKRGINAKFEVIPGFKHEWRVWELTIQRALEFFGMYSHEGGNAY